MNITRYVLLLLGGGRLRGPDGAVAGPCQGRNAVALMALLATASGRRLSRDRIIELLWPDREAKDARHSLNVVVYEIRKALGARSIVTDREDLVLDPSVVDSDVERFEQAVAARAWDEANRLYAGPFLDGFRFERNDPFQRWVDSERSRYDRMHRTVLLRRAEAAEVAGDVPQARRLWRELHEIDPASAAATLGMMRILEASGCRAEAIDLAHDHRILMLEEYGADPDPDVEALADRLREAPRGNGLPATASGGPETPSSRFPSSRGWGLTGAALVLVVAVLVGADQGRHQPLLEGDRVLIAGFEDVSGDPALDDLGPMATHWIAQELSRTGLVRPVLPVDAPGGIDGSKGGRMEAAERVGAGLLVLGRYAIEGDSIRATATIVRVPTGEVVRTIDRITAPRDDPGQVAERLRRRVTGSLAAIVDDRLLPFVSAAASQPPSYEAYRLFAEGIEKRRRGEHRAAADAFHRAADRDTTFTLPLVYAALSHRTAIYYPDPTRRDARQAELADSVHQVLRRRRDALPPWEAAWVDYLEEQSADAMRRITELTPEPPWLLQRATKEIYEGRPGEALEVLEKLKGSDPDAEWNRRFLELRMHAHHLLGEYEAEHEIVRAFLRRYPPTRPRPPRTYPPELYEIRVLAALGRMEEVERRLESLMDRSSDPWAVHIPLMEVEIHGHRDHPVFDRTLEWFLERSLARRSTEDPEEMWRWGAAIALWKLGRLEEARAQYERLRERAAPGSDNPIIFTGALGQIAADLGDRPAALRHEAELASVDLEEFPEPHVDHLVEVQRINIAIALGERQRAIGMLEGLLEDGYPLYANGHPEMFHLRWLELSRETAYRALVRPR